MAERTTLDELDLGLGKWTRLHRMLYEHGPGDGRLLILPIDHGVEHGPVDFFPNPPSGDPDYQWRLSKEGGYSGIALHIGLAKKYMRDYAGDVPLILKLNGRPHIPPNNRPLSAQHATVEDAVRLGADAVGYTVYVGSPLQKEDFHQLMGVRTDCDRYGMPLVIWAYPRGEAIDAKGGRDTIFAVDYAARLATELGADVVKLNVPKFADPGNEQTPEPYRELYEAWKKLDEYEAYRRAVEKVTASAGRTMVLFSGGSKVSDEDLLAKARICMESGATGLIFGRNMWQRPFEKGLEITERVKQVMRDA
jgi:class I fructose-bisphosphate aldolase